MNDPMAHFRSMATARAAREQPLFQIDFSAELGLSRQFFHSNPLVLRCREDVQPFIDDNFGHGADHARKVAIDAGAIIIIESADREARFARHLVLLAQLSGLLHDTCRLRDDHACRGASLARDILQDYPLSEPDRRRICYAISTHEAFRPVTPTHDPDARLLSDALYDADKFRWGPDNFTTTLWEICDHREWTPREMVRRFPSGLERLALIRDTFRTRVGIAYGPEYIDIGIKLGRNVYQAMDDYCRSKGCT